MLRKLCCLTALGVGLAVAAVAIAQEPADPQGKKDDARPERPAPRRGDFFSMHDTDKDGKLTLDELTAPMKKLIAEADKNEDGVLTKEEYDAAMKKRREERRRAAEQPGGEKPEGAPHGGPGAFGGRRRPSAEELFKRMDADGNGSVTLEEFKKHYESRTRRMGAPGGDRPPR